ncbi:hypothetical protein C8J56DRAFT_935984 [Mycena floridula]|nr:hypothetical protein C8J56DRAFT_935984 [Mycena floridula]
MAYRLISIWPATLEGCSSLEQGTTSMESTLTSANQGIGCNTISESFAGPLSEQKSFLLALQASHPSSVPMEVPWRTCLALPRFWTAMMNYDLWGPWSASVGPNAPPNATFTLESNRGTMLDFLTTSSSSEWPKLMHCPGNNQTYSVLTVRHDQQTQRRRVGRQSRNR